MRTQWLKVKRAMNKPTTMKKPFTSLFIEYLGFTMLSNKKRIKLRKTNIQTYKGKQYSYSTVIPNPRNDSPVDYLTLSQNDKF